MVKTLTTFLALGINAEDNVLPESLDAITNPAPEESDDTGFSL